MARMLPPFVSADIKSSGEKRVFGLLQTDPETKDWIVLHSLGLSRHIKRRYGEIDFVVMAPGLGIFCLEVKSGKVSRQEGVWTFTDRFGATATKVVSPFMQARDGMFSLIHAVRNRFGNQHPLGNLFYRYGVMFPDIYFQENDPEFEGFQVYDLLDRRRPISAYIKRLSSQETSQVHNDTRQSKSGIRPTAKDVQELAHYLRGDFELVVPPRTMIQDTENELLRLTEEQYHCLDQVENNPRCIFEGGAGTGKTVLAMELARREALIGKRVLLLCFNRFLGVRLKSEFEEKPFSSQITTGSFHRYLQGLIDQSSYAIDCKRAKSNEDEKDFYSSTFPAFALAAIEEKDVRPFDALIVDEGQDLICPEYLDVLDSLITGGINGGKWAVFCDLHHQAIFSEISAEQMLEQIDQRASRYVRLNLTVNCRNTRPIGEETALLSGFERLPFLTSNVEGPPVDYCFFSDPVSEREQVRKTLTRLLDEGVSPGYITILSPVSRSNSSLSEPLQGMGKQIEDLSESSVISRNDSVIRFATIQSFKGLENSIIIITDIHDLSSERSHSLLYVGMSRAKHRLFVFASIEAKKDYALALQNRIKGFGVKP
jgi:hypothetical protein